jgi:hypothetical protein
MGQLDKAIEDHDQAVRIDPKFAAKVLEMTPEDQRADYQTRLDLYRAGQPFREEKK